MAKQTPGAFAAALKEALAEHKERLGPISQQSIADQLGVAKSAVSGWLSNQLPRAKHIDGLADILGRGDDALKDSYRDRLFLAAGMPAPVEALSPLRRAQEGKSIRIAVVRYGAFSKFFVDLLRAFAQYSGYTARIDVVALSELSEGLRDGRFDIGAAIFATPDRASKMRFINTPLKVGVNALTFSKALPTIARLGSFEPPNFRPIVANREAGWLYSTYVHEYRSLQHEFVENYDPKEYSRRLLVSFERWLRKPESERLNEVPAVLADEEMCLEVVNELMNELYQRENGRSFSTFGLPVILLGKEGARDANLPKRDFHPSYHISICTNRSESIEWHQYLEETLAIFLSSNSSFVGYLYAELHKELSRQLKTMDDELMTAEDQLAEALGPNVDLKEMLSDPWKRLVLSWTRLDGADKGNFPLAYPWSAIVDAAAKDYADKPTLEEQKKSATPANDASASESIVFNSPRASKPD